MRRLSRIAVLSAFTLAAASVVGGGSIFGSGPLSAPAVAADTGCVPSPDVPFFRDPVAQPPVARPDGVVNGRAHYTLTVQKGTHSFSSQWPAVPSLGYNGAGYLGPTIVTRQGQPIEVTVRNDLPAATQLFPWDPETDQNTVVVHRHGGLQQAADDGIPGQELLPGQSRTLHYPNSQPAAPLWYHDHAEGVTSYRVYEGLAGLMPNTDAVEPLLNLPSGDFAKAYVLQDKTFQADGSLCYTHNDPEFFGDLPVVNGTVAPFQQVQPRRYKFTFANGSDSRFYHLTLQPATPSVTGAAPRMTVVGSDEGYLRAPARVNDLLISPGERYTVVVDFTGHNAQDWVLGNDAAAPFPDGGGAPDNDRTGRLMAFKVGAQASSRDTSRVPPFILEQNNGTIIDDLLTARLRTVQAGEIDGMPMLGDAAGLRMFTDPVTETPQLGSTEVWALRNHSPDAHPIHLHLVELRLVGRWPAAFDENGTLISVGAYQPPGAFESGPKDTFVSPKGFITAWVGTFTIAGRSVWHCHILSHEDTTMMRPIEIGSAPQTGLPWVFTRVNLDRLVRQI